MSTPTGHELEIELRFFAAAAKAFNTRSTSIKLANKESTIADLISALLNLEAAKADPAAKKILNRCSFLVDSISTKDPAYQLRKADGSQASYLRIDVLPPFAGG